MKILLIMALWAFCAIANAQHRSPDEHALLLDTRGAPVMSADGLCWHTAYGPVPLWTAGCHLEPPRYSGERDTSAVRPGPDAIRRDVLPLPAVALPSVAQVGGRAGR